MIVVRRGVLGLALASGVSGATEPNFKIDLPVFPAAARPKRKLDLDIYGDGTPSRALNTWP